jgi:predicted TIM-barrel fold metal-dependent hydrolase
VIVDAHAHVWALETSRYPWYPTFGFVPSTESPAADLLRQMERHDVGHAVLIQPSAYGWDHRFLLDTVQAYPTRFVAVGLVDPADAADTERAAQLVRVRALVGLRVNLSRDVEYATIQAHGQGWQQLDTLGIPICLRAEPAHWELLPGILERHRGARIVVDHLGLPEADNLPRAIDLLAELAVFEHCSLKICGLGRFSRTAPPYPDTWPLVRAAHRAFGSSRLLWGSDYPEGGQDGYDAAVRAIESMPFLSAPDRDRLMSETSCELWGAPGHRGAP